MKVLHVLQGYPPAMGGTEQAFAHISEELVRQFEDDVTVFTTNCYGGDAFNRFGLKRMRAGQEVIKGVKVFRFRVLRLVSWLLKLPQFLAYKLKLPADQWLRTLYQGPIIAGLVKKIRKSDADLVVASSFPLLHMYTALKAAKKSGKRIIFAGGLHPEDQWSFDRPIIAQALKKADGCIAYTGYEAEQLKKMGVDPKRIYTIGLGVDMVSTPKMSQISARKKYGLREGPVVGFIGQISAHKGVGQLIEAMKVVWSQIPEAQLLIAGAKRPFAEKIKKMIDLLPEEQKEKVVLIFNFEEEEKSLLYMALDIFVYPSKYESFGIAFLEAWNAHRPVVAFKYGAIPWVVDDKVNGLLVEPPDPTALAEPILYLLRNPQAKQSLAENGFQKVASQYTWPGIANQFQVVYRNIVERGK